MNSTFCILGRYLVGGIEGGIGRVMVMTTRVNDVVLGERVISEEWKYKGVKYYKGGKDEILGMRLNGKPQWRMGRPITE